MDGKRSLIRLATLICWALVGAGTNRVLAQDALPLIVVTDASVEESFRRIGNKVIQVTNLFDDRQALDSSDYRRCNDRARRLCDFQYLVYRKSAECLAERFWRQRLILANPGGKVWQLADHRWRSENDAQVEQVRAVHKVLSDNFPQDREQLDVNLRQEMRRIDIDSIPSQLALLP